MKIPDVPVNTPVEHQLFRSGGIAVTMQALIDHDDATVLYVVEARDVSAGKLLALYSTAPVGLDQDTKERQRALREYLALVESHSGPF